MPHFVIDCSEDALIACSEAQLIKQVHFVANDSGLFDESEIKVRIRPFSTFSVGNKRDSFIHVFSSIMQGRTTEQKAELSKSVVKKLASIFPNIPNIAMNVSEFEKATYCKRSP